MKQSSSASSERTVLPNPNNYNKSSSNHHEPFKLSKFSQLYSYFKQPNLDVKLNTFSKYLLQSRFTTRIVFTGLIASIGYVAFTALPSSSTDYTISYFTNISKFNMTNLFKSRLYHKKETCFLYKFEAPYPYMTEYDLTQDDTNTRMFLTPDYLNYWDDLTRDLNDPANTLEKGDLLIHPLDLHIFSIRKGKPMDLEHLWYLYLQVHSIKYDAISQLIYSNKVSNDLLYYLKIATNFDH